MATMAVGADFACMNSPTITSATRTSCATSQNNISQEVTGRDIIFPSMIELKSREELITPRTRVANAEWLLRENFNKLEYIIEEPHIVTLFLLIVYMDIILGTMSLSAATDTSTTPTIFPVIINVLRRMILYLQCIELLLQMFLFHHRFFSHWGYCFDTLLVGAKLIHGEQTNTTRGAYHLQLLSYLRVWRFIRVVQSYMATEISNHHETKAELSNLMKCTTEYKRKIENAEEEIETLHEALRVAAMDVSEMRSASFAIPHPIANVKNAKEEDGVLLKKEGWGFEE